MVGLDAAGKTTILYKLKLGEGEWGHFRTFLLGATDHNDDRDGLLTMSLGSLPYLHHSCYHDSHHW